MNIIIFFRHVLLLPFMSHILLTCWTCSESAEFIIALSSFTAGVSKNKQKKKFTCKLLKRSELVCEITSFSCKQHGKQLKRHWRVYFWVLSSRNCSPQHQWKPNSLIAKNTAIDFNGYTLRGAFYFLQIRTWIDTIWQDYYAGLKPTRPVMFHTIKTLKSRVFSLMISAMCDFLFLSLSSTVQHCKFSH